MFENVKKNFGFGCMRLPMKDGEIDYAQFNKMIDTYIEKASIISIRRTAIIRAKAKRRCATASRRAIRGINSFSQTS